MEKEYGLCKKKKDQEFLLDSLIANVMVISMMFGVMGIHVLRRTFR